MAERWCVVHGVLDEKAAAVIVKRWGKGAGISEGFRKRIEREAKRRKAVAQGGVAADSEEKKDRKSEKKDSKSDNVKVKRERSAEMGEDEHEDDDVPLAKKAKKDDDATVKKEVAATRMDDDSEDDVPLAARKG